MFDQARANRALAFLRLLKDPKGGRIGQRKSIRWLPWQEKFFTDIIATVDRKGHRQYHEAFVEIPRKNGKSTMIAALVLYQLFMSDEYGQEIYSAANDRSQASLVFNMAASMIRANPALQKRCRIYDSTKRIVRQETESVYAALSRESSTAHGLNPSMVVYDELHEAKNRELYDTLKTGMGARDEPLFVTITTAGSGDDLTHICYELYNYSKSVLAGAFKDKRFYPLIFEAGPEDDIWDEATWKKANPSAGAFRKLDEIREFAKRAQRIPTQEIAFRRLYLNQWVQGLTRWMRREAWNKCAREDLLRKMAGRACYAGLDLSSTNDFCALVLVFPMEEEAFAALPFFWIPQSSLAIRRKDGITLTAWERAGLLEDVPGEVIDYGYIIEKLKTLRQVYNIQEIAFDRWGAAKLRNDLEAEGFTMVQFGQGFVSMSPPMKECERLVATQKLWHTQHGVLDWMITNTVANVDPAGNIKPDKEKSPEKIDGAVAMIMGLDRAVRWKSQQSPYESRPMRVVQIE